MKVLSFDQFEFENPQSEEHLKIACSKKDAFPHPHVQSFVASAVSVAVSEALPDPEPFTDGQGYGLVQPYLSRFAGIVLPELCTWPTYVLAESDNEFHAVICGPELLISYQWSTNA